MGAGNGRLFGSARATGSLGAASPARSAPKAMARSGVESSSSGVHGVGPEERGAGAVDEVVFVEQLRCILRADLPIDAAGDAEASLRSGLTPAPFKAVEEAALATSSSACFTFAAPAWVKVWLARTLSLRVPVWRSKSGGGRTSHRVRD